MRKVGEAESASNKWEERKQRREHKSEQHILHRGLLVYNNITNPF